jgi:SAM-dependent methyltransferase
LPAAAKTRYIPAGFHLAGVGQVTFLSDDASMSDTDRSILFTMPRERWQRNLRDESAGWDRWFEQVRAGTDKDVMSDYTWRIGPRADVRDKEIYAPFLRPVAPPGTEAKILDVGAGPLTYFPRQWFTRDYSITPIDPLADEFDRMLKQAGLDPQYRTIKGEAETLLDQFGPDSFHCVFARNALEQFYDPLEAIRQMLAVVRPGAWVLLQQEGYRTPEEQARLPMADGGERRRRLPQFARRGPDRPRHGVRRRRDAPRHPLMALAVDPGRLQEGAAVIQTAIFSSARETFSSTSNSIGSDSNECSVVPGRQVTSKPGCILRFLQRFSSVDNPTCSSIRASCAPRQ